MICPVCKKEIDESNKFCPECGAKLVQDENKVKEAEVINTKELNNNENTNDAVNQEQNGLSITSLILSIAALVCMFLNSFLSLVCSILAIIFGAVGRKKGSKGIGTAGMIIGIIALVIEIIILIFAMLVVFFAIGAYVN